MVMNRNFNGYGGFNNQYYNPQQQMSMQMQPQPTNTLKMVAVTNKEEANATPVEFNGMPMFFYNQNSNEIYLKQFDIATGGKLEVFRKVEISEEKPQPTVNSEIQLLNDKIDNIKIMIENLSPSIGLSDMSTEIHEKGGRNVK